MMNNKVFFITKNINMLISVIGNICTGKSIVCNVLMTKLKGFKYYSIDEYRSKTPSTIKGEEKAWATMLNDFHRDSIEYHALLETSGVSKHIQKFYNRHRAMRIIKLECDPYFIFERFDKRGFKNKLPYNYTFDESYSYIDEKLKTVYSDHVFNSSYDTPEEITSQIITAIFKRNKSI